jgi:tellurium resistance protein TerZ
MKEIVMGLHWDPPQAGEGSEPADLDALCVLYDSAGGVLEVIHPAHSRSADGSVIHTGDSRTGTSAWDDERIFVFLDALAPAVAWLEFVVASPSRHAFDEVPGALCHISDRLSETRWVSVDLTAFTGRTACTVATLRRGNSGWHIDSDAPSLAELLPAEVQAVLASAKREHCAVSGRS